ncbi:hypothetical protein [Microbacterium sp. VKM Ac-2923]|uniref:hypothetical protein n=1 Tax=Microbacterium sp. VKM Ac-2923 TaxID=2929476 RepID=UPI001FB4AAC9|nr:hypothetical protein [Microbacterium sp. VKM Ac-2923]MCJ1708862.1 hypothetical protein [Microbacterium sp. VKM Ac-2923]
MVPQSARIRDWLGGESYLFATASMKRYDDRAGVDRSIVNWSRKPDEGSAIESSLPTVTTYTTSSSREVRKNGKPETPSESQ